MGNFDLKYAAYERAMQQHGYFGLKGNAIGDQLGRYAEALQYKETKEANRAAGREFGHQLAAERRALSQAEQNSLSSGLNGEQNAVKSLPLVQENVSKSATNNEIKIADKMKVGTSKKGFKYYLVDSQGQVYQVDKKAYNVAKKGKKVSKEGATLLDPKRDKIPEKIKKSSKKVTEKLMSNNVQVQKNNYNIITDPQAYNKQRADMYEKLWGNFSHPSNTPLGIVEAKPAGEPKTWAKYLQEHGKTYTKPVSGVVEADRLANNIIKGNEIKQQIKETLSQKTEFNPSNLEKWSGHAPNPTLQAMSDYYRELESQQISQAVKNKTDDLGKVAAKEVDNIENLGKVIAQQDDKIEDLGKVVAQQSDKIDDLTKKLAKSNKKVAVVATIATVAAGAIGYLFGKSNNDNNNKKTLKEVPQEKSLSSSGKASSTPAIETVNKSQVVTPAETDSEAAINQQVPTAATTAVNSSVNNTQNFVDKVAIPANVSDDQISSEQVDEDENEAVLDLKEGKYVTKQGDNFWNIAQRYLEEKYADEPEKYKNLSKEEQNSMIQQEAERIMKLNGYSYDLNHNFPKPMLSVESRLILEEI